MKVLTGGDNTQSEYLAHEPFHMDWLTWCDPKADGQSPDGRGNWDLVSPAHSRKDGSLVFTGIIEEVGKVLDITHSGSGVQVTFEATKILDDIEIGASIAVNGCCLTVTDYGDNWWSADAVPETMDRTSLGSLTQQSLVNLERPVQAIGRLGGHIVQGHVDLTTRITNIESEDDGSYKYTFDLDDSWSRYICEKGSIAIDGISLTVADVDNTSFSIAIIPHTWEATNLSTKTSGDSVNIEVDVLAKYVERQLIHRTDKKEDHA